MPSVEMGEVNLVQEIMQCGVGAIVRTVAERKTQVLDEEEADNELSQLLTRATPFLGVGAHSPVSPQHREAEVPRPRSMLCSTPLLSGFTC